MSTSQRRRLALATVTLVGALATLVTGVSLAIYSGNASPQSNGFTSGTVTVGNGTSSTCNVNPMAPGDSPAACTLAVNYSGSLPAYMSLDLVVETQAGSGGTALYNPSGSNGLTVGVTDGQSTPVTYTVPTTSTPCPSGAPSGSTCYELDNELVGTGTYSNGDAVTFSTSASLPLAAANGYQGGTAQIVLTAHAVQSANNTLACTTTPTAGSPCSPGTGFAWS